MEENPITSAMAIWVLLVMPGGIISCLICAYYGLVQARTITHIGIRSGVIARWYGIFYMLVALASAGFFVRLISSMAGQDLRSVARTWLEPLRVPMEFSVFFIGMGAVMWLVSKWAERKMASLPPERVPAPARMMWYRSRVLLASGMTAIVGLLSMTGWPIGVTLFFILVWTYFEIVSQLRGLVLVG